MNTRFHLWVHCININSTQKPKVSYLNTTHMAENYENKRRSYIRENAFHYPNDNFKSLIFKHNTAGFLQELQTQRSRTKVYIRDAAMKNSWSRTQSWAVNNL